MKKRVFCLILTALMMTGALPATAFAEGAEETPAVEAAADEALPAEEETAAPDEVLPAETETIAPDETLPAETETTAPEEALPAEEEAAAPDEALPGEEEPVFTAAGDVVASGESGTNVTYRIIEIGPDNYELRFSGTGMISTDWHYPGEGFNYAKKISRVVIEYGITGIGYNVFQYQMSALTEVQIPNSVSIIRGNAFQNCTGLTSITIPGSVVEIRDQPFYGCSNLRSITLGNGVETLGYNAFMDLASLEQIVIPSSVKYINQWAFKNCTGLHEMIFPEGLEKLDVQAFEGCTNLQYITIPGSVKNITSSYFDTYIPSLRQIRFAGTQSQWNALNVRSTGSIEIRYNAAIFTDVMDPSQFYFRPIYWGADEGIITGWDDGTFRPMNTCNRAAIVTFLYRYSGSPTPSTALEKSLYNSIKRSIRDLTGNAAFDEAIIWARMYRIADGWNDGTFRPWNNCNRAAVVSFLWKAAGKPTTLGPTPVNFSDMTGNSDFDSAIRWAASYGIVTGYSDNTFRPWNACNRLAVATFLYRFAEYEGRV